MDRAGKQKVISDLNAGLSDAKLLVITHYQGLTVAEVTDLRNKAYAAGVDIQVTKNTLTKLALKGTEFEMLADQFTGPTAIAVSKDPIAAAKIVAEFAKTNEKLIIVGGAMDKQKLSASDVKALASLPSLDELRAKIIGLIQAPATKVAGVLQAPASKVARVFNAYATK